ncbi:MAG TPA: cytochrome P450 [Steroidobacteraceae bacterium]|nr:cytochrome P450 [Steroidobacteraceae bacterium]
MSSIHELELARLPIETAQFGTDPMPFLDQARHQHDWLAASSLGYVVTDYRAMDEIMRLDNNLKMPGENIVDLMGARGTGWGHFAEDQMLARSGAEHARLRGSVSAAFAPGSVNRMRPVMQATVAALLDEWAPKGAFEFTEFAANFPIRVMFALIGTTTERLPEIITSLEIHGSSFNMEVEKMAIIEQAYQTLWGFVDDLIARRGPNAGKGDLLDHLIAASSDGTLSDTELRQILILLFAAGYDTSKNLLTLLMHSMIQAPAIWKRCAEDAAYCRKVVVEQLRHTSPSNTYRVVTQDFNYRDVDFPQGTMLIFPISLAGRDPAIFSNASTFDPERPEKAASLAFGRGMHFCVGKFLAQANVEEGAHLIAQRITNPRLAGEVLWRGFPGVWGIKSLPIEFDPK